MRALVLAAVACGSHPAPAPAPAPQPIDAAVPTATDIATGGDACTADADCIVTNFAGCCACPQCAIGQPVARSRDAEQKAEQVCTVVECDRRACDIGGMCPPGEAADHFVARCADRVCVAAHR